MAGVDQEIIDTRVDSLVLGVLGSKRGLSTDVAKALRSGTLTQSMGGASTLKIGQSDPAYGALNSGVFEQRLRVSLDGVPYRFTQISLVDQEMLELSFEHWLISEMREHDHPLRASRNSITRAEFILKMLRELKLPYAFICPALRKVQAVAAPTAEEIASATKSIESSEANGRTPHASGSSSKPLTLGGQPLTDKQKQIASEGLTACESVGAAPKALVAYVEALIVESTIGNPPTGDKDSKGSLQVRQSTANGIQAQSGKGTLDPMNVAEVAVHFIVSGYYGKGGANALARAHPDWSSGTIAQAVQGSDFPSRYDEHKEEAEAIVSAWQGQSFVKEGASGKTTASSKTTVVKTAQYEYFRGKPEEPEDTFTCAMRLAEEVLWRFFVLARKGRTKAGVYFTDDDEMIRSKPRYTITPNTVGAGKLTFDLEVGKRLVSLRGKKQPKPSEATLEVRTGRWMAPPGTVIELADYGIADGKWLVDTTEHPLFDDAATITLRQPQKALPEPRESAEESANATEEGGTSGGVAKATPTQRSKLAAQHPELKQGVRDVVATILAKFPRLTITSTTGGTHATHSLHYEGRAADLAADPSYMNTAAKWVAENLESVLTEGIHNPGLSIKDGKKVDPSFWGSVVWAEHTTHLHIGV